MLLFLPPLFKIDLAQEMELLPQLDCQARIPLVWRNRIATKQSQVDRSTAKPIWDLDYQVREFWKSRQKHGDYYVGSNLFRGSLEG